MQAMVIVTSGTNCDLELAQAFEDAGASCQTVELGFRRRAQGGRGLLARRKQKHAAYESTVPP